MIKLENRASLFEIALQKKVPVVSHLFTERSFPPPPYIKVMTFEDNNKRDSLQTSSSELSSQSLWSSQTQDTGMHWRDLDLHVHSSGPHVRSAEIKIKTFFQNIFLTDYSIRIGMMMCLEFKGRLAWA